MALSVSDIDASKLSSGLLRGRSRRGVLGVCLFVFIVVSVAVVISSALFSQNDRATSQRGETLSWASQFTLQAKQYQDWFLSTPFQGAGSAGMFKHISDALLVSATYIAEADSSFEELGFFPNAGVSLHFAIMRLMFVVVAWWRLWLIVILLAGYKGLKAWKPYLALTDFLGSCSNGRLFYSGIRADLRKATKEGAPDVLAPGLACPRMISLNEAKSSEISAVLQRYSANCETNQNLVAILEFHKDWPAYVAKREERDLLDQAYQGTSLPHHAAMLLETVLNVHASLNKESRMPDLPSTISKASPEKLCSILRVALIRSLSEEMKVSLSQISAKHVATVVLSMEAGKVMTFGKEGPSWALISRYPQLCARSILHSIAAFSSEFSYPEREMLRRAIIYGSRRSIFGPVKFAVDLSDQTRALRQWVELLMAAPHELLAASDEVEMYSIICEAHQRWYQALFDGVVSKQDDLKEKAYVANNMLFVPLATMIKLVRLALKKESLDRLSQLTETISASQQLKAVPSADGGDARYSGYDRVFLPLSEVELREIVSEQKVELSDLKAWSAARTILDAYSWLGRRVGSFTVPDSSVVTITVRLSDGKELTLPGMVPLRGTQLKSRWGDGWATRFKRAESVRMTGKGFESEESEFTDGSESEN